VRAGKNAFLCETPSFFHTEKRHRFTKTGSGQVWENSTQKWIDAFSTGRDFRPQQVAEVERLMAGARKRKNGFVFVFVVKNCARVFAKTGSDLSI
jgi:hypothetical protein